MVQSLQLNIAMYDKKKIPDMVNKFHKIIIIIINMNTISRIIISFCTTADCFLILKDLIIYQHIQVIYYFKAKADKQQ